MKKQTQSQRLIRALKRREHTYLEMILVGAGCSPWKRVSEGLGPGWKIVKGSRKWGTRKLITWKVVKA